MEPTIECQELFLRLSDDEVLVVDCRTDEEWSNYQFQIPGALRMSVREMREWARVLPDDELIVLCGIAFDGADAREAYWILQMQGLESVCLDGGLRGWIRAGLPTERCTSLPYPTDQSLLASS